MNLRDSMTLQPDQHHVELHDALRHARKIIDELRCIRSLQHGHEFSDAMADLFGTDPKPPAGPKGPPDLKLVS
jgi:hypothetical protein